MSATPSRLVEDIALHICRTAAVVLALAVPLDLGHAQDGGAPPTPPRPPAWASSQDLVGKSVRDLAQGRLGAAARDDIKALRRGPLLIHGNYCGIGNRPGAPPIDSLDAACMRHDSCTATGHFPSCTCDDRLRIEATEIAADPTARADLRALAAATAASMAVLICK